MENLDGQIENVNGDIDESIVDPNPKDKKMEKDVKTEKDAKIEKDNNLTKPEDLDGLQMLRLAQEDKTLLRKDIVPSLEDPINQQILFEDQNITCPSEGDEFSHEVKCFQISKPIVKVASQIKQDNSALEELKPSLEESKSSHGQNNENILNLQIIKNEKQKGKESLGIERKPALVKKEVSDLHGLTERQQKFLQDFHVKFVLEGVDVEEDDEAKANKHSDFIELKKRLEEEEKMYAGCALGEASDIDQIDVDPSNITPRNLIAMHLPPEDINSLEPAQVAVRATMDEVINSFAEVAICRQESSPQEDIKPLHQFQNARYAMKDLVDDDGLSELQEYTNREGSTGCQCCCRKAGKQIDEGDDNDVYMTNSSYSVLNVVCPVSGMPVVELDDPVRSEECEHIYDRASALSYIANMAKDGFCLCASPGCRALLAENKLVADNRLWQDIEELRQIKAAMWESRMLQDFVNTDDSDDD
ncbi:hypothetical protein M758_12G108000 [Ceratodon purpureus]|nr:hypothetical protein M758_12G108000 [Ceratodon purpureus]